MDKSDLLLSNIPLGHVAVANCPTDLKRVGEGSLHSLFQLNTLGPSVSPQIKNLKG